MDASSKHAAHRAAVARYYAKKKQDPDWAAQRYARNRRWAQVNRERLNALSRAAYARKRDARLAAEAAASETAPKECQTSIEQTN